MKLTATDLKLRTPGVLPASSAAALLTGILKQEEIRRLNTARRTCTSRQAKDERVGEIALHDARILVLESAIHHLRKIK